jgi:hypothetical protein
MAVDSDRSWKPLEGADVGQLRWVRVRFWRARYELRAGADIVASLQWGLPLAGRTKDGRWTLTPTGGSRRDVEIAWIGSSLPDAVYEYGRKGNGSIVFADGQTYCWTVSRWRTNATWTMPDGRIVLRLRGPTVTVETQTARPAHLSVLVLLAQYLNARRSFRRIGIVLEILGEWMTSFHGIL